MGEFDLSLISEFRSRPSFYDRNSPRFKDKLYNAREWQEISNKLGFDVSILKDRILQLRNRYNLEKRRIEQLREDNPDKFYDSPWPLYDHLHFLSDHIRARRSYKKMLPLNGNGGGDDGGGSGHYAAGPELSNSCSNNSNLSLRHVTGLRIAPRSGQNITAYPNGLLAVKMEDNSEDTEAETESQNYNSEIRAFETTGLIPETHSSLPQTQPSALKHQQHHPTINIRCIDSLRQDFVESSSSSYNKKQRQQQQQGGGQYTATNRQKLPLPNDDDSAMSATPNKQPRLSGRELKYTAFGNFISSSLLELRPTTALALVEKFTSDIVKVLMANAQQEQEEQHCNISEN